MSANFATWDDIKDLLTQFRGAFCSIASMRLRPGAKINGVLFDGTHDIDIPNSLQKPVFLTAGQMMGICYEDTGDGEPCPGWVFQNDGIYFTPDGSLENAVPVVTAVKNQDGTFTVELMSGTATATPGVASVQSASPSNVTPTASTNNTIGFRV